ncbi:UDP-N-acetylmuramyl peptide synthase [Petrotoga sp. 9PWA.NaAc.5.4]|nr:UDP-N-acetylmuramyl peptide synthase [Petrotoga sp. 9PWA.NaAc.5.4]
MPIDKIIEILGDNIQEKNLSNQRIKVRALKDNSDAIEKNDVFFASKGHKFDGHDYISSALEKGASLIIAENKEKIPKNTFNYIIVKNIHKAKIDLTYKIYGISSNDFKIYGVTGTNGKSTSVTLMHHILRQSGKNSTLISTVEIKINDKMIKEPRNTTPGILELAYILKKSKDSKVDFINLEVSSHALEQKRITNIQFDIISFTNITRDHLDYHKTFEEYKKVKLSFIDYLKKNGKIIINSDLLDKKEFLKICDSESLITYGFKNNADYVIEKMEEKLTGTEFILRTNKDQKVTIKSPLLGKFNVYNITNAFIAAESFGLKTDEIIKAISTFKGVPGRFQIVPTSKSLGFYVVIDFAHTPDALEEVLSTASSLTNGRVIIVFGAGGNADQGKRKIMGEVVSKKADIIVLTNDDPKDEDPDKIIEDVKEGIDKNAHLIIIPDRQKAIDAAISFANKGDIVIIAGRGHEKFQLFANGRKVKFNDFEVAKKSLEKLKRGQRK